VRALWALERHRQWRERPLGEIKRFEVSRSAGEKLLQSVRNEGRRQLTAHEGLRLLGAYGIPVARSVVASNLRELTERARGFPFPAALKAMAPEIVHKTEVGGVALDLRTPEELTAAARRMIDTLASHRATGGGAGGASAPSFLLQEYVRGGREVIVGMTQDSSFGPLLMFGLGGIFVETLKDVTFRVPPLADIDAEEMIHQISGYALLAGVRGEAPIDFKALAEVLQRFSRLVEDFPDIAEIEVNPFLVFPDAAQFRAVDARIRLSN
jgi:acyl-CoA synthetase (NDP forming)